MKLITLRGIPDDLADFIETEAAEKGLSLNKTVIHLLKKCIGYGEKRGGKLYHDLDSLSGSWDRHEFEAFTKVLKRQRVIESELWK
ncbi:MAG: hypothetical protein M1421_06840 [Candidatus Eremiobacteraeota bacterium]|nr:hypothetical protein [Candidatus Eremiobacteraeota bacterium]